MLPMRATTGRAVSAAIHRRLREALATGKPFTHSQLAAHAGCTVRSVRNYLARAEDIFGFRVERYRDGGHSVLVHAVDVPPSQPAPRELPASDPLASALLHACLPHRVESPSTAPSSLRVLFAFRGFPSFSQHQTRALDRWIAAAAATPLRPLRIRTAPANDEPPDLVCWPVGAVIHATDGIQLVALPLDAETTDSLRTIDLTALEDSEDALSTIDSADILDPPVDPSSIDLATIFPTPFTGRIARDVPVVNVHVRFAQPFAPAARSRVWHQSQRVVVRHDGSIDVRFGPVPLDAAASWAASFGRAIEVVGDKRLRKTVKKRNFEWV